MREGEGNWSLDELDFSKKESNNCASVRRENVTYKMKSFGESARSNPMSAGQEFLAIDE